MTRGRPKGSGLPPEKRRTPLSIALTPEEREVVTAAAANAGVPRGVWIRRVLLIVARSSRPS